MYAFYSLIINDTTFDNCRTMTSFLICHLKYFDINNLSEIEYKSITWHFTVGRLCASGGQAAKGTHTIEDVCIRIDCCTARPDPCRTEGPPHPPSGAGSDGPAHATCASGRRISTDSKGTKTASCSSRSIKPSCSSRPTSV